MLADHLTFLQTNSAWFIALVIAVLAGAQLERSIVRHMRRNRPSWKRRPFGIAKPSQGQAALPPFDAAEQLRHVERASFRPRKLLNDGEARLFGVLERACSDVATDWRVMAQVSLGEILASSNADAYRAINSKRVDLLLVARDGHPLHAIELQGTGHHLGPAATRDAVKKEALRKAGIGYVEVLPGDTSTEIRALVAKLAGRRHDVARRVSGV